jgi:hypothetical protein
MVFLQLGLNENELQAEAVLNSKVDEEGNRLYDCKHFNLAWDLNKSGKWILMDNWHQEDQDRFKALVSYFAQ